MRRQKRKTTLTNFRFLSHNQLLPAAVSSARLITGRGLVAAQPPRLSVDLFRVDLTRRPRRLAAASPFTFTGANYTMAAFPFFEHVA